MNPWIWLAVGLSAGALLLRRRSSALCSPVDTPVPLTTPHGAFGFQRKGPPEHPHQGVDLVAPAGSHVVAVGDGVIVATAPGLGKVVRKLRLEEPAAWTPGAMPIASIVYADLGTPLVNPGDRVRAGQPIALVAKRGFVHFAVKTAGGRFVDPRLAGFVYRSQEVA